MTFQQELTSWRSPKAIKTSDPPAVGSQAPSTPKLSFPAKDGKPTVITFLRHCGCPFAEKTFQQLINASNKHPEINFIAVSHSDQEATDKWLVSVGGQWEINVIVDYDRELYAQWGLGVSSAWHVLNPWSMYSVYTLGKKEGIWNKPTESGSRWQTSGSFAVDKDGVVRWVKVAKAADEIPDFAEAMKSLEV